jgi:regulatory protein
MTITDIKQQVKRQDRYSVYLDKKYSFSLSENELLAQGLRVGQEFDNVEFNKIKDIANEDKAYTRALDLLSRRPRTVWEMQQYLKSKSYQKELIDKIVGRLVEKSYLSDMKFAESWVSSRRALKRTSKRKIKLELKQKHVSDSIINEVVSNDETIETEVIKQIIEAKRTQSRYSDQQKLVSYLARQGFNYSDIKTAIEDS